MNKKLCTQRKAGWVHLDQLNWKQGGGYSPKIYVASLSDYNTGRLHGIWIDADQDIEAIHFEVQAMLGASREPGVEEWAIHDFEDFGAVRLSEFEDLRWWRASLGAWLSTVQLSGTGRSGVERRPTTLRSLTSWNDSTRPTSDGGNRRPL